MGCASYIAHSSHSCLACMPSRVKSGCERILRLSHGAFCQRMRLAFCQGRHEVMSGRDDQPSCRLISMACGVSKVCVLYSLPLASAVRLPRLRVYSHLACNFRPLGDNADALLTLTVARIVTSSDFALFGVSPCWPLNIARSLEIQGTPGPGSSQQITSTLRY